LLTIHMLIQMLKLEIMVMLVED
uniref:NADH dehydrogenase subunit 4L n=1 Tax=Meloidogyne hapla TaxID=6305 RepID=A0A1I8B4L3_MELHA